MNEIINYTAQKSNDRKNPRLAMMYSGIYSKIVEIQAVGKGLERVKEFLLAEIEDCEPESNRRIAVTDVLNKFFEEA